MKAVSGLKNHQDYAGHKKLFRINRPEVGLFGFVALHGDKWNVAVGGTRIFPYKSEEEAISDVLRLSSAMTSKCALAGVPYDGGKAVLIADPSKDKNKGFLKAYAEEINQLKGKFYTGEDVGLLEEDVQYMLTISPYFIGNSKFAGDPSPYAALSTYYAMQAAAKNVFGSESLEGKKIAIKGVGKVGGELVRLVREDGADVWIADIDKNRVKEITKKFPDIHVVSTDKIHTLECDIYSPCALGKDLREDNIKSIKARIICGAANNQLSRPEIGDLLFHDEITYVPDYVANSGGLIDVVDELNKKGFDKERVLQRIADIKKRVSRILALSHGQHMPPHRVADQLAAEIVGTNAVKKMITRVLKKD